MKRVTFAERVLATLKLTGAAALALAFIMITAGCDTEASPNKTADTTDPVDTPDNVFAVDISAETDWNYMVVGTDGSSLFFNADEDTGVPTLLYLKPDKDSDAGFTYLFKENGLVDKIIADGHVLYFGNYNGYKFDMAVIYPDDTIEYFYDIETDINWDAYNEIPPADQLRSITQSRSILGWVLGYDELNWSDAVGAASCGTAWIPGLNALTAPLCGSYVVGELAHGAVEVIDIFVPDDQLGSLTIDVLHAALDGYDCLSADVDDLPTLLTGAQSCVAGIAGTVDILKNLDLDFARQRQPELAQADGVINGGRGDIKATLSWNNLADVDLHIVDPYGEEIYYAHKNSASGGALDMDNRYGYGPENIYWASRRAPAGTYEVYVNFYSSGISGASNSYSDYTVLINAFGNTKTYTGTVTSNTGKVLVATFNSNGVITQGQSGRQIVIDMYDSRGDGWDHSGALRITVNGAAISNARLSSGISGRHTFFADAGDEVNMYWTGNSGDYHKENAFAVYYADTPPAPAFNAAGWSGSNALLFRVQNSLSNTNLNQLLGSFTVSASGASRAIFGQSRIPLPPKEALLPETYSRRQ
ncbi:MAG: hypothetical protein LBD13_00270 [Spirochaetaceae bacterium]|jgi:hypothetical protein|nr:hypothetical protein [Spirochaetaceae bacterium]